GVGCRLAPSSRSPMARSDSGKRSKRYGRRRAASAAGAQDRQRPQQTAEQPATESQAGAAGNLDGREALTRQSALTHQPREPAIFVVERILHRIMCAAIGVGLVTIGWLL